MMGKKKGVTRRVFINRSVAATGGALILANSGSWPAWAGEPIKGTFTRMPRMVRDPEDKRTWLSFLHVDLSVDEIDTEWGPTRVTETTDKILVKYRDGYKYSEPVDVSGGQPDAKLDPRIDARNGKICAVWAGCHPETREWRIFATFSENGVDWIDPVAVAGGNRPALHPDVAVDPETGNAHIAYEDWADGSIRLIEFDGRNISESIKLSEGGKNFRPKLIVTDPAGKHKGAVAVAWDSYRDLQYDIYLRLAGKDGKLGDELRVTKCPRWDSDPDLIEDLDSNIWIAWVRASNEQTEYSAMRSVHVRFYDGELFLFPIQPETLYDAADFIRAAKLTGRDYDSNQIKAAAHASRSTAELGDGRLTWFTTAWHPKLQVDSKNRVYVFYREGDPQMPMLLGHVNYRVYEGDKWTEPLRLGLGRKGNILRCLWDISLIVAADRIEGVWEQGFMNLGKAFWEIMDIKRTRIDNPNGPRVAPHGEEYEETMHSGWARQETFRPSPSEVIDGRQHELLFGDTHTHSWTGDGADPADYHYHFARDFARLDFYALSDHDFLICGTPGIEAYIAFLPKMFTSPEFVCFHAYEFTSSAKGHWVVLFEGDDQEMFPYGKFNSQRLSNINTTGHLHSFLHKFGHSPDSRVLISAHNMFLLGNDFSEFDPSIEPIYDVTSLHVCAEQSWDEYVEQGSVDPESSGPVNLMLKTAGLAAGNAGKRKPEYKWFTSWRQCLDAQFQLGAYGQSDTHCANGTGWITGGVWASERNRKAIFDAMYGRQTIAIDSLLRSIESWNMTPASEDVVEDYPILRADVRFWLDEHFMGEQVSLSKTPTARAVVQGRDADDHVHRVVFVKDGKDAQVESGFNASRAEVYWKDHGFEPGRHYYYVRVEFASGRQAFSSPVFVG